MRNVAKKIIIYSMVGLLQVGFCASVIEASPGDYGQYQAGLDRQEWAQHERENHDRERQERIQRENYRHEQEMRWQYHENERDWHYRQERENLRHEQEMRGIDEWYRTAERDRHIEWRRYENERHEREMERRDHEAEREWHERQELENERHNNTIHEIEAGLVGVLIGSAIH